jgi:hypothetical protein
MTGNAATEICYYRLLNFFLCILHFLQFTFSLLKKKMNRALQVLAQRNLRLIKPVARNFATSSTKLSGQ